MDNHMALSLQIPSASILPSYQKAFSEGFQNMQLGFGDGDPFAPDYIENLLDEKPFEFSFSETNLQRVHEHKVLWLVDKDDFIGSLAFRFRSDPELEKICGHIGVTIAPSYRQNGFATKAMELSKEQFRTKGFERILYTVSPTNSASVALVRRCGGVKVESLLNPHNFGPTDVYSIDT
jgi:predicted acetyltransferase